MWFIQIQYGIAGNGMGPTIISWGDLRDWQEQMGIRCERWEKLALVRLAHARAVIESEKTKTEIESRRGTANKNRSH